MDLGEHRHLGDGLAETFHDFANEQRRPALLTESVACAGLRAFYFVAGRAEADRIGAMRDHAERAVPSVFVRELRPEASPHHDGMARRSGIQGGWRLPLLWLLKKGSHRDAAVVVVRGTRHREHLVASGLPRVAVVRDGYAEQASATPRSVDKLKQRLGLDGRFGGGVMGSLVFSPSLGICHGRDLVRALVELKESPVTGLIIEDGDGETWSEFRSNVRQCHNFVMKNLLFCKTIV